MPSSKTTTPHLIAGLRRTNMDLCISTSLIIKKGLGELEYPQALKREPLKSNIQCECLYLTDNAKAKNEPYFITCSASTYRTQDNGLKANILGMFQNKPQANIVSFTYSAPITVPQEKLEVRIVDYHGKQQDLTCIGVFRIHGSVANRLLAI